MTAAAAPITEVRARAYTIPTSGPESDGTLTWDSTTLVVCHVTAGGVTGVGYTYDHEAAALLITRKLAEVVEGRDALDTAACWEHMVEQVRNLGRPGVAACAIAAVDAALWDLKGRLLDVSCARLMGLAQEAVPVYGSGGFTNYDDEQLDQQLSSWVDEGLTMVKMKVGTNPDQDPHRVRRAREAIGPSAELFVDANGAYSRKQALAMADIFATEGVTWFEEPVTSDDLEGLRFLRDRGPAGLDITAGEYGYDTVYFRRMMQAGAVDCLQADATRCMGPSGFLRTAALCRAFALPLSAHTAPSIHLHTCCATAESRHVEYFHDHVRIEHMLFDGAAAARDGCLRPDLSRPGLGIEFRTADAEQYAV